MAHPPPRTISARNIALDTGVTLAAFVIFFLVVRGHVPSRDPMQIAIWSAFTATCLTAVFWLAWQMVKAVFRHQHSQPPSEE
jgi:hypothetical protein